MCFTNVNEAGIRYRYFMYSTNKCTDFNKKKYHKFKKKRKKRRYILWRHKEATESRDYIG